MNKTVLSSPDGTSRSFATDEPRADLSTGHPVISNKLWAGMATAAVVAAVGVGALAAPPASLDGSTTAAAQVAEAASPPSPSTPAETGSGAGPGQGGQAAVAAVAPQAAPEPAHPAGPAPAPAPDPAGASNRYTVAPGDTVGAIAASHGVDMNAMLAATTDWAPTASFTRVRPCC